MDQIIMTEVESSNIQAIGYSEKGQGILLIAFKGGGVYEYSGVPQEVYTEMLKSDSKGKFFAREIKDKYKFFKAEAKPEQSKTEDVMDMLSKRISTGMYDFGNEKVKGIRSRQVIALIDLLVEKKVL